MGMDISEGVFESKKINAPLAKVELIQGAVLEIPFISNIFEFAYLYGVLHHTPNPCKGSKR